MSIESKELTKNKQSSSLGDQVRTIAGVIAHLEPGPAAQLRRGPTKGAGSAAYWKLMAQFDLAASTKGFEALVQCIAILTPKKTGDTNSNQSTSAFDYKVPMGRAMYLSGISELRLAHFLNAPLPIRQTLAIRLCRRLTAGDYKRFDLQTLASVILFDQEWSCSRIAEEYYRAETENKRTQSKEQNNE